MDFRAYLRALRKSWLLIAASTVLGLLIGLVLLLLTPPTYASNVTFYISSPVAPNTNAQSAGEFAQDRVTSYVQLLQSDRLAEAVAVEAGLPVSEVREKISASAEASTVVLTAQVTDSDQQRAVRIAGALAVAFPELVDVLDNAGRTTDVVTANLTSGPSDDRSPVAPSPVLYLGMGLLLGLVVGVAAAVARALLDQSVQGTAELAELTGAPVIGSLHHDSRVKRTPLVSQDPRSVRAEEFRRLRTNLRFIDATQQADVLVVTSPAGQEGKSFVSANLALSMAEDGRRVLLMDADLRRPSLATLLGRPSDSGLSNVLAGQVRVWDATQEWEQPHLAFLPSGEIPPSPAELLGAPQMIDLLAELRQHYDKIIIDSPPVLPVADASLLAAVADGVILVVHEGRATRASVRAASEALHNAGARVVGAVSNGRRGTAAETSEYSSRAPDWNAA